MKRSIKPIAALLTFSIGVAVSLTDFYPIVLFSPVALFFLFHALLLGVVIHQLIVRKDNRRQVTGKGIIAIIMWLVPSLMTFFISTGYMLGFVHDEIGSDRPLFAPVVIAATSVVYGLAGWGLCRWVRNPRNEVLGFWEREWRSNY